MTQFPKNELAQLVIASCVANSIKHVVISPGSRNAPLTIGFSNHPEIQSYSIVDERCAAFFALGISQQIRQPVAIVCTSGSALLNYYPAISEAYYSNIPLVVISADRPNHLIDVGDGQTIRQENVFENHILASINLRGNNKTNGDLLRAGFKELIQKKGPIHINAPFDEPLYEVVNEMLELEPLNLKKHEVPLEVNELQKYADIWNSSSKKMVLVGANFPDELLQIQLNKLAEDESVIIFTETTSNVYHPKFVNGIDKVVFPMSDEELEIFKPDILLTFGGMFVSKRIKQYLRKHKPVHHWHVDLHKGFDTFFSLSKHFEISPQLFFSQFFFLTKDRESNYQNSWLKIKNERIKKHDAYLSNCEYSDLKVFENIVESIPDDVQMQLSNSSIIRYTQLFDINNTLSIFCNRGTSGIDGSTSTAIGASYSIQQPVVFVTGDLSFFYDSNALWNNYIKSNFRIILINNSGGGIFKFIPGPKESNALSYFEAPHSLTAQHLASMYDFEYLKASDLIDVKIKLAKFYLGSDKPKILEIFTPSHKNDLVLKSYFKSLK